MATQPAPIAIDVGERNAQSATDEHTAGRGADIVLDAVGHPEAYRSAVSIVRRGGRIVVVGMYAGETVDLQLGVYWARALEVRFAGICPVHAWWRRAMERSRTADRPHVPDQPSAGLEEAPGLRALRPA